MISFISSATSSNVLSGKTAQLSKSTLSTLHNPRHAHGSSKLELSGFAMMKAISIVMVCMNGLTILISFLIFLSETQSTSHSNMAQFVFPVVGSTDLGTFVHVAGCRDVWMGTSFGLGGRIIRIASGPSTMYGMTLARAR